MVKYVPYGRNGVRVSTRWARVLKAADKANISFTVNSGHRTMAEQWALYRQNMSGGRPRPGRPLTAFPNPNAPHIFTGRNAHALDVSTTDGGETRLQRWLESKGARVTNPVPGEAWHLVVSTADLKKLAKRFDVTKPRTRKVRKAAKALRLSDRGLNFIAAHEGLKLTAYKPVPSEKHWTIGYGHYGPDVKEGQKITGARAKVLLRDDVRQAEGAVRSQVHRPLTQGQFDALTSFAFNVGTGAFGSSTLLKLLNRGRYRAAAKQFARWVKGGNPPRSLPGLVRRRADETKLFNS